jgi:uracil-DNA glycosylase
MTAIYRIPLPGRTYRSLDTLLAAVRECRACEHELPLGARLVLRAHEAARVRTRRPGAWPTTCAELWLDRLLAKLPEIELTLLVGQYAQRHFLGSRRKRSLAETTRTWQDYSPQYIPLPHPSPRNQPWFKRHPWFAQELVPTLQMRVRALVSR